MVGQHDAAGADANRGGTSRHITDQHGGRRARDSRHPVMLGQPKAPIAPTLRMARQVERITERVGRVAALRNGREIKDGKGDHEREMGAPSSILKWELSPLYRTVVNVCRGS